MKNHLCDEMDLYIPTETEAKDLHASYIVNIVLNALLAITAICLNIVTILALRRTSSLSKPFKTLLLSLAVSDLGVGLLWEPFNIAFLVKWLQQNEENNPTCALYTAYILVLSIFCMASFLSVMALSVDRFLAIHLHLRYQELVTYKRIVAVVVSIWLSSAITALLRLWVPMNITLLIFPIVEVVCFVLAAVLHFKIYFTVQRHRIQIHAFQAQIAQNSEMTNVARLRKSALGSFYVYLVFLACFLPQILSGASIMIYGSSSAIKGFILYSVTLLFLNSTLNPVIYCWKMRHIRHAIMDILRSIFPTTT